MSFFDTSLVEASLSSGLATGLVEAVVSDEDWAQYNNVSSRTSPTLIVGTTTTVAEGTGIIGGRGNNRQLNDEITIGIYIRLPNANTGTAIRNAIFNQLEGTTLATGWAPLKYEGGSLVGLENQTWRWVERYSTESLAPVR